MSIEPTSLGPNWWTSLTHGGLLIAPAMVEKSFSGDLEPLPAWRAEALRRALTRRAETGVRTLLDTVFTQILGYDPARWNRNPPADQWSKRLINGDTERPDRLYSTGDGLVFPIFTEKPDIRIGYHRGRQAVARVVEWLRKSDLKIGLLATEQQWRLIYAGSDFEAWCEWNLDLWFEAGQPALQVEALRRLLDPASVPARLLEAIQDSRRGQSELTSMLGERVRQAVEKLIQSSAANLENLNVLPSDIYLAATRMIMRCVVALFAEGKAMLGRDMPSYHDSYGVQGLREQLERISLGRPEILIEEPHFAWPRLISLFRLIHSGSSHPQLTTTRYGGTLFEPGDPESADPVLRAVAAFESTHPCPRDQDVYDMLLLLTRTYVKVSQGRGARAVPTPVDFSNLDTEYIGILYEGLLDYDLKRADEPVVFLRMGDEPALRVSDLEAIPPNKLKDVFGKLQKKSELSVSDGEGDDENDERDDDTEGADAEPEETAEIENALDEGAGDAHSADAASDAGIERARKWAVDAVRASGRVRAPRRQTEQARVQYEEEVAKEARNLFSRIVRTGDWYLVRFGNTRKGSGTFYTRKELASPTVRRTLAPLVRDETGAPRTPEEILAVKVCDPAVGSGSFLISALRYITEALYESLYRHDRIYTSGSNRCYKLGIVPDECLPDAEDFEDRLRARLRRHVVERCLYGVDLNPLAIELARMSLWIETLDPRLPFGFLDHKLKAGNSLVGCWFDRFEDYPIMAWMREGGDKDYEPVNPRANWTKAIAAELRDRVKVGIVRMIGAGAQQRLPLAEGKQPAEIYQEALARLNAIHGLSLTEPERQRDEYRKLRANPSFERLRLALDCWCALWFWPGDQLRTAPTAADFLQPSSEAMRITTELRERLRFFHWELEFPDVFTSSGAGFDAVVGNPPWEIQKPNSKEFFSNIDPLYRTYGKQEALRQQKGYFRSDSGHEDAWIIERARLKSLANWIRSTAVPFGDRTTTDRDGDRKFDCPLGRGFESSQDLHRRWAQLRRGRDGYADTAHPYAHQGSADLNTYKMFLETGYRLLRDSGRLGMIVPSGIYSDQGSTGLRTLFLEQSRWEWLFSFENREKVFDIDSRFKFNPLVLQKGGRTETIRTGFMHQKLHDWDEAEKHALDYPGDRVVQFSPASKAPLEIRTEADLNTLEKLYATATVIGASSAESWNLSFTREFHMTDDSDLFASVKTWEERGFRAAAYGRWIKGGWRNRETNTSSWREEDAIASADATAAIELRDIEDIAVPLYQGVMIDQLDHRATAYVPGGGGKPWRVLSFAEKRYAPQHLISQGDYIGSARSVRGTKVVFRDVTGATNERSFVGAVLPDFPTGNTLGVLKSPAEHGWSICAVLDTIAFDWIARQKLTGTHLNKFILFELPAIARQAISGRPEFLRLAASLALASVEFANEWLGLRGRNDFDLGAWRREWAVAERTRIARRCALDAATAVLFGYNEAEYRRIIEDCDYPEAALADKAFTRRLFPKGFWRVDKEKPPHLRHTVLSFIAFHELERIGLDAFLALNDGQGWMLPETVRLADYGLCHDDRAKEHQPVASVLGPGFYDWQLSQSVDESWEECERHAELLAKIVPSPSPEEETPLDVADHSPSDSPVNLFGEPVPTDLFGNPEYSSRSRRRR